ncbi:Phosphoglucomutase/phosphomannomutase [Candidatus Norongarragalina meridionalis]|nr:Phosphoglucomutase/phosphomannomutase [Candidatus Norongarragalina meridionalis]
MAGIFKQYDVRGVYPSELDEKQAERIGNEFGRMTRAKEIALAGDSRLSTPVLKKAFAKGATRAGCNIIDVGIVPTPFLYFAVAHYKRDAGAMITASHNPPEYNGVKLCRKGAECLTYESGIREIEERVRGEDFRAKRKGIVSKQDVLRDYTDWVVGKTKAKKKLVVVVDCGNGVCGAYAPEILRKAGCIVSELYCEPDGSFPNHAPDPTKDENVEELARLCKGHNADLGIAFDGDGDRVVFLDDRQRVLRGDETLAIFAKDALPLNPAAKVVFDVKSSRALPEVIRRYRGMPIMNRVGHSYTHERLLQENALLAGEVSGHFYFAENHGYDDGIFAALKMCELVSRKGLLSSLLDSLPEHHATPEIRVPCPSDKVNAAIESVKSAAKRDGFKMITLDGVRVEAPEWWGLVRASNTEPLITMRMEGSTKHALEEARRFFGNALETRGIFL